MADTEELIISPDDKLLELRDEFESRSTPLDHASVRATSLLALPVSSILMALAAGIWTVGNTLAPRFGVRAPDPPPFEELQAFSAVAALVLATLILAGQRRENEASRRRSQLTLHFAAQSEHKIAKLIALLEEQRRHNPMLPDREDAEAQRMAKPSEPRQMIDRLERSASDPGGRGSPQEEDAEVEAADSDPG